MPVFFGKIKKTSEEFYYSDPVFNIYSVFPNLPIFSEYTNFLIVFSNEKFPEADYFLKKTHLGCELNDGIKCEFPSVLEKYFEKEITSVFFFLHSIKEG